MARITKYAVEVAYPRITPSPTTPTGASVSQAAVEVAYARAAATVRVSQCVIEVAAAYGVAGPGESVPPGTTPSAATTSFGFAS